MAANDILNFWFHEIEPKQQFSSDPKFDLQIRTRFLNVYESVVKGETVDWRNSPKGRLAEIIVLDQFSRNMFRNKPEAFSADALALRLAKEAVKVKADLELPFNQSAFIYMPYMHSENKEDHEVAVLLFSKPGMENSLKFELLHKKIIDRFGRYPHRNEVLGRVSTPEEIEFLKEKGSSF